MVTSILEKAIEIEGLLRIIRDGNPLPETYKLLNAKTASLAIEAARLSLEAETRKPVEVTPKEAAPTLDFVMAAPTVTQPTPEVNFAAVETAPAEERLVVAVENGATQTVNIADIPEDELDLTEEDDIILSFDDFTDPIQTEEASTETSEEPAPEPEAEPETDKDAEMKTEATIDMDTVDYDSAIENTQAATEEHEDSEKKDDTKQLYKGETNKGIPTEIQPQPSKRTVKLKSAFSLNDRFLYARELFNSNMKTFDSTLDFIEGIDDYALVEDYFYSELDWDPENPNVVSFMEILRPQFEGLRVEG